MSKNRNLLNFKISRREFLSSLIFAVIFAGYFFASKKRVVPDNSEETLRSLIGHFFPNGAEMPGALELGLLPIILDKMKANWKDKVWRDLLMKNLNQIDYLTLSEQEQRALIASVLFSDNKNISATFGKAMQHLLDTCAALYFTDERTWGRLGYHIPQPQGFLEFNKC